MSRLKLAIYSRCLKDIEEVALEKISGIGDIIKNLGSKAKAVSDSQPAKTMSKELANKIQQATDRVVTNRDDLSRLVSNKRNLSKNKPFDVKPGANHTGSAGEFYKAVPGFKPDNYDEMIKYRKEQIAYGMKQLNKARQEAASELGGAASQYGKLPKSKR
jgi:hypothetical protein